MQKSMVLLKHIMLDKQLNYIPSWLIVINAGRPPVALIHMESSRLQREDCFRLKPNASQHAKRVITHLQLISVKCLFGMQIGLKQVKSTDSQTETQAQEVFEGYLRGNTGSVVIGHFLCIFKQERVSAASDRGLVLISSAADIISQTLIANNSG